MNHKRNYEQPIFAWKNNTIWSMTTIFIDEMASSNNLINQCVLKRLAFFGGVGFFWLLWHQYFFCAYF